MPCPLRDPCKKLIDKATAMPLVARLILVFAIIELGFAFVMEYGFGYQPCELCLLERVPYIAVIVLAGLACLPPLYPYAKIFLGLCGLAFLIGFGLSTFHTGVERHWWLGTPGCAVTPLDGNSVESLRQQLLHMAVARCDQIVWTLWGLSMANWNALDSLTLAVFTFYAARKASR